MTELPTHMVCPVCKHKTRLAMWVYAHWREKIIGTCEGCGAEYNMQCGVIISKRRKRNERST